MHQSCWCTLFGEWLLIDENEGSCCCIRRHTFAHLQTIKTNSQKWNSFSFHRHTLLSTVRMEHNTFPVSALLQLLDKCVPFGNVNTFRGVFESKITFPSNFETFRSRNRRIDELKKRLTKSPAKSNAIPFFDSMLLISICLHYLCYLFYCTILAVHTVQKICG